MNNHPLRAGAAAARTATTTAMGMSIGMASFSAILLIPLLLLLLSSSSYYYYYHQHHSRSVPVSDQPKLPLLSAVVDVVVVIVSIGSVIWMVKMMMMTMMRSRREKRDEEDETMRPRAGVEYSDDDDHHHHHHQLPPGSQGILPFIGETLKLIAAYKTEDPEPFIDERVKRNGGSRIFTSHVFGERTVFSAEHEFNRVVLGGEGRTFECSYPSSISTLLGKHSLVLMKGSLHKRMHSLTLTRFSSSSVLRHSLLPDIDRLVRIALHSWSWSDSQHPLLLLDQAKKITFELTIKQLMSCDPGEWTEALRREYLLLIDGFFSVPFPSFLSFTTYGRAIQARKKVADKLRGVVRKRKEEKRRKAVDENDAAAADDDEDAGCVSDSKNKKKKKNKKKAEDMLDELIEADYEGGTFREEEIVDFLLALLVAGYETTPTIMTLVVKFLTDNPPALALLKEEHDEIRGRKKDESDPLEWSDYKAMHFTQCVINETLRVANIVSGVFRRATTDIHYKGYRIPKGCKVFASFRAVHLDPENFKDARTFNPWRWQKNNENGVFTPFGVGPRMCPGYELARLEISVFLHYLVTRFSWDVAEQDKLVFFPTTRTLKGYPIIVRRRKSV